MLHADVSVRPAITTDALFITEIQLASWAVSFGEDFISQLDADAVEEQWHNSLANYPSKEHGIFVACARELVVGFALVGPEMILALEVTPEHRGEGHGSRLLSASIDKIKGDDGKQTIVWVAENDNRKESFFTDAGFGLDGRVRELAGINGVIKERRLITYFD